MNFIMVPLWGALGAAIATAISYWLVYAVSMYFLNRSMNVKLSLIRDNIAYGLLIVQSFILLSEKINTGIQCGLQLFFVFFVIALYGSEIKQFKNTIKSLGENK